MTNNPLTEAQARKRHERREEYTVAIGGFDAPTAIIEVVNRMVAVTFFDALLRRALDYEFSEVEPGCLRLVMAVRRRYCEATPDLLARLREGRKDPKHDWGQFLADIDRVLDGRSVHFRPEGTTVQSAGRHGDARDLIQPGPPYDPDAHWEPYPDFGEYGHLLRRDRDIPWGPGLDGP
jgi:hypothetical protein